MRSDSSTSKMAEADESLSLNARWKKAFNDEERPILYSKDESDENGFSALTSPKKFFKETKTLSHAQMYLAAENCQLSLKAAQDEFMHLEKLIRKLEGKEPAPNPQALDDLDKFDEIKEASLYGYKRVQRGMPYTRAKDGVTFIGFQEPFSQGGFVPTEAQFKRMKANAKNVNNIDDWTPVERDGKKLVPRLPRSPPPRQLAFTQKATRASRKRGLVDQVQSDTDATAGFSDSDVFDTPGKRSTRFLGRKIPPTRDASETPGSMRASPAPKRSSKLVMAHMTPELMRLNAASNNVMSPEPASPPHASPVRKRARTKENSSKGTASNGVTHFDPDGDDKKWTDTTLVAAITTDHNFLHPDPATALAWKTAILHAPNPVRSYAMKRKWAWWRKGGLDKRPRRGGKEEGSVTEAGDEDETQEREGESHGPNGGRKPQSKKTKIKVEDESGQDIPMQQVAAPHPDGPGQRVFQMGNRPPPAPLQIDQQPGGYLPTYSQASPAGSSFPPSHLNTSMANSYGGGQTQMQDGQLSASTPTFQQRDQQYTFRLDASLPAYSGKWKQAPTHINQPQDSNSHLPPYHPPNQDQSSQGQQMFHSQRPPQQHHQQPDPQQTQQTQQTHQRGHSQHILPHTLQPAHSLPLPPPFQNSQPQQQPPHQAQAQAQAPAQIQYQPHQQQQQQAYHPPPSPQSQSHNNLGQNAQYQPQSLQPGDSRQYSHPFSAPPSSDQNPLPPNLALPPLQPLQHQGQHHHQPQGQHPQQGQHQQQGQFQNQIQNQQSQQQYQNLGQAQYQTQNQHQHQQQQMSPTYPAHANHTPQLPPQPR